MMLFRFNPEKVMRKLTLLIAFVLAVPVAGQEQRAMTTDDGLDLVRVGDAMISPDGSWVLFSKSELNWEENERETTWWRVSAEGGEPIATSVTTVAETFNSLQMEAGWYLLDQSTMNHNCSYFRQLEGKLFN